MAGHVFISHSFKDSDLVAALRQALEAYGSTVWTDVRKLAPGDLRLPSAIGRRDACAPSRLRHDRELHLLTPPRAPAPRR